MNKKCPLYHKRKVIRALILTVLFLQCLASTSAQWQQAIQAGGSHAFFIGNDHRAFAMDAEGFNNYTSITPFYQWSGIPAFSFPSVSNPEVNSAVLLDNGDLVVGVQYYKIPRPDGSYPYTGGLYRYNDRSRSWSLYALSGHPVSALARTGRQTLIAAVFPSQGGGYIQSVMQSTDQGQNWRDVLAPVDPNSLVFMLNNDNLLATDSMGMVLLGSNSGVYVSRDSGTTWNLMAAGLPAGDAVALLNERIFATADHDSVYITSDGGSSWSGFTVPNCPDYGVVRTMTFLDRNRLLVGAKWGVFDGGLFMLELTAQKWTTLLTRDIDDIIVLGTRIMANTERGMYRSEDGGQTWKVCDVEGAGNTHSSPPINNVLEHFARVDEGEIIKGTGVYTSSSQDNGTSWDGALLSIVRNIGDDYFNLNNGGVLSQLDQGVSYLPPGERTAQIFPLPDRTTKVGGTTDVWFATTVKNPPIYTAANFYRGDYDGNYTPLQQKLWFNNIVSLGPDLFVAGVQTKGPGATSEWADPGIYVSNDKGYTWSPRSGQTIIDLKSFANGTLVIATPDGIEVSNDNGLSWTRHLTEFDGQKVYTRSLLLVEPSTIIANVQKFDTGYTEGIFRSDDRGATWRDWSDGLVTREINGLGLGFGGRVFAATPKGIHYRDLISSVDSRQATEPHAPFGEASIISTGDPDKIVLRCELHTTDPVLVRLCDATGAVQRLVTRRIYPAGVNDINIETRGLASGAYLVQLCTESGECMSRMVTVVR